MRSLRVPILMFTACCLLFTAGEAAAENHAEWKSFLYGRSTDDSLSSSRVVGLGAVLNVDHDFGAKVHAHALGGVLLETGSASSLFTDEFQPLSRLFLTDARLEWQVLSPFFLSAGALDQTQLNSPLLMPKSTFPAAMASVRLESGYWRLEGDAEAAIPTGQRLETKSSGKENTPALLAQTLTGGWKKDGDFVVLRANHFDFRNLTHGMAQDSRFYGNTVTGVAAASAFVNEYEGFELGSDLAFHVAPAISLLGGASFVSNVRAYTPYNQGKYGYAGLLWQMDSLSLRAVGEWYESQADSTAAYYTSSDFGHNNRRGPGASLQLHLRDPALAIEARFRDTKLINPQPFQKDQFHYFEVLVGIPYEKL